MTMREVGWLCAIASAACGRDIALGGTAPDAAVDAMVLPFTPGTYRVSFLDPQMTMCDGALAGHEADFAGITRASSGLVDGQVDFTVAIDHLTIVGPPIQSAFAQPSLTLTASPDPQDPGVALWDAETSGSFGAGPDATQLRWIGLAVDSGTAHKPSGIEGAYAGLFLATDSSSCNVMFGALFVSN